MPLNFGSSAGLFAPDNFTFPILAGKLGFSMADNSAIGASSQTQQVFDGSQEVMGWLLELEIMNGNSSNLSPDVTVSNGSTGETFFTANPTLAPAARYTNQAVVLPGQINNGNNVKLEWGATFTTAPSPSYNTQMFLAIRRLERRPV